MSDTDSFIEEVSEEVRRDKLFALFRKYGWIPAVLIVVIVAGASWNEYRKAQARAEAQALGDRILSAFDESDAEARAAALVDVQGSSPGASAIVEFALAGARAEAGQIEGAVASLEAISLNGDLPLIYRQIASFKALALQSETMAAADRRIGFEALAQPGAPLRLLAEEQLALIDLAEGDSAAAIARFQSILKDAEATSDLQQRAVQAIVALGGTPEDLPGSQG
jgi:hypothetical protein